MIIYERRSFGVNLLFRLHGSAAGKALLPAFISTIILLIFKYVLDLNLNNNIQYRVQSHPYPFGVLIGVFTFLLTFRANFSYNRYWEAAGAVHQMMSKWLDVGIEIGAFHMQSKQYDQIKPPTFGKHPELKYVNRKRERITKQSISQALERLDEIEDEQQQQEQHNHKQHNAKNKKKFSVLPLFKKKKKKQQQQQRFVSPNQPTILSINSMVSPKGKEQKIPMPSRQQTTITPHVSASDNSTSTSNHISPDHTHIDNNKHESLTKLQSVARLDGGLEDKIPSLFLQETCHLLSLLCAVAFSTLRNDNEHLESPLIEWVPGDPWPPVDPDMLSTSVKEQYGEQSSFVTSIYYLLGVTRTEKHRSLYNMARPFRVLGGISDSECQMLQCARGPYGKVALCTMWLQEFLSREYMAGSTGNVAPPIISRLFQFTSDGMVGYNQARKIAYIPFPFPHAQITSWFNFILIILLPVLNLSWCNYLIWACILNFLTMLCFAGVHEVARELEAPFQNAPNDLPLTTFQAQFNEALVTMYAGYHPDAFWTVPSSSSSDKSNDVTKDTNDKHAGSSNDNPSPTKTPSNIKETSDKTTSSNGLSQRLNISETCSSKSVELTDVTKMNSIHNHNRMQMIENQDKRKGELAESDDFEPSMGLYK